MTTLPGKSALEYMADASSARGERRRSDRRSDYHAEDLHIEPVNSVGVRTTTLHSGLGAQLVDVSEFGMGLNVLSPLLSNTDVKVSVNLLLEGCGEELKADARVVHCLAGEDNFYRVGLVFWQVDRRPLDYGYVPDLDA